MNRFRNIIFNNVKNFTHLNKINHYVSFNNIETYDILDTKDIVKIVDGFEDLNINNEAIIDIEEETRAIELKGRNSKAPKRVSII
jgi:hypothetical protein